MAKDKTTVPVDTKVENSVEIQARRETSKSWYRFNYLEQPGQKAMMSPGYVPWDIETGERKKKAEYHRFELEDGEMYELPTWLVEKLNTLTVPEPYTDKGPGGQIKTGIRHKNRFSLVPVAPPVVAESVAMG